LVPLWAVELVAVLVVGSVGVSAAVWVVYRVLTIHTSIELWFRGEEGDPNHRMSR